MHLTPSPRPLAPTMPATTSAAPWRGRLRSSAHLRSVPGLALCGALAAAAVALSQLPILAGWGLGALTLAIVLGLALGNSLYPRWAAMCSPGVGLAKQQLLRTGIVLYGLRLTFQDIAQVGWAGVAMDALVLASTFALACWLGQRVLGLDRRTTWLIGAGSSICGAAAVLATAPVVKARSQDVAVAIATVVVLGTVATFLYPALYHWSQHTPWALSEAQYGLYVGATVHEVAQVVAAGSAITPETATTAVIAKMVRVMLLAPFLLLLSWRLSRHRAPDADTAGQATQRITLPWFALGFVALAGVHSLGILPPSVVRWGVALDNVLLAMAMAALGLTTHWRAVHAAGARPLLLAGVLLGWLLVAGAVLAFWLG